MTDTPTRADLIERLLRIGDRVPVPCPDGIKGCLVAHFRIETNPTCAEAAAALTADAERIAALEGALHPFARAKHIVATVEADGTIRCILTYAPDADQTFTLASLDAARAALKGTDNDPTQIKGQEA